MRASWEQLATDKLCSFHPCFYLMADIKIFGIHWWYYYQKHISYLALLFLQIEHGNKSVLTEQRARSHGKEKSWPQAQDHWAVHLPGLSSPGIIFTRGTTKPWAPGRQNTLDSIEGLQNLQGSWDTSLQPPSPVLVLYGEGLEHWYLCAILHVAILGSHNRGVIHDIQLPPAQIRSLGLKIYDELKFHMKF